MDDDGFQYLQHSMREVDDTADWANAHNQKFAAGFQALCPDSERNKVNSRLPAREPSASGGCQAQSEMEKLYFILPGQIIDGADMSI